MINKKLILVLILCSVFVVGLQIAEPVSSASWKKFDSGYYKISDGRLVKYTSYIKGVNQIRMNNYKNSKLIGTTDFVKTGSKVVVSFKNGKGKSNGKTTIYTKLNLKNFYHKFIISVKNYY